MKIVVAGAGAVGGYYGAMLARAGHELFFIARGAHLNAIRKNGLHVQSYKGDFSISAPCGQDSSPFGPADLILVCFKSYQTKSTVELFSSCVGGDTAILSLQNGVDNELVLAKAFGQERVLGAVAFIGARVERPGVILHTGFGSLAVGELFAEPGARAQRLGEMFEMAGIKCRVSANIKKDIYAKMVWNVGFNGICSILDCSAGEALGSPSTRGLVRSAMMEWIAVARGVGVELDEEMVERNIETTAKGGEVVPSMVMDKRNGRIMEIDSIIGKVVELGLATSTPTPVNQFILDILSFHNAKAKGRIDQG
ncbi:MAG: 2-dehydropantoate 2-reductase [Nitrospinota bacterium]|nr:2-dehydropantoate 2-reductase [Nitrospinota bacterium]MDH5678991.1 2-dehydropantoate 2-reductase [Nitrospinota bacterium]